MSRPELLALGDQEIAAKCQQEGLFFILWICRRLLYRVLVFLSN